jgi:hypothetical protein
LAGSLRFEFAADTEFIEMPPAMKAMSKRIHIPRPYTCFRLRWSLYLLSVVSIPTILTFTDGLSIGNYPFLKLSFSLKIEDNT